MEPQTAVQTVPEDRTRDLGPLTILVVRIRGGWANIFIDEAFKGRAQFTLPDTLAPGKHTLQLVLGDANHIPHDPPVTSQVIEIRVE